MNFSTLEEIKDQAKMTASLQRMKRTKAPMRFWFKARCEELENQPLLLLASPGRQVDRNLVAELSGSKSIWGRISRRGAMFVVVPKSSATPAELARLISMCGNSYNVPIPRNRIMVSTRNEVRAFEAVRASVVGLRSVTGATPFFFRERCESLNKGPALMLKNAAPLQALGGGSPIIRGTVERNGRGLTFRVTTKVNERKVARAITKLSRRLRIRIPIPTVVYGGAAPVEDAPGEDARTQRNAAKVRAQERAETKKNAQKSAVAQAKKAAKAKAKKAAEAKAKKAEVERQEAEAQARQEAEAQARQEAEAQARQEAEAQARQEAEAQARKEAERNDPKLQRRYNSAVKKLEDSREEIAELTAGHEREKKTFKTLKTAEDSDALIDMLSLLQDAITSAGGKPDKELLKLQRIVQRAEDVDEAIEECEEWFEERKEDLADELNELQEEADALAAKVEKLRERLEG